MQSHGETKYRDRKCTCAENCISYSKCRSKKRKVCCTRKSAQCNKNPERILGILHILLRKTWKLHKGDLAKRHNVFSTFYLISPPVLIKWIYFHKWKYWLLQIDYVGEFKYLQYCKIVELFFKIEHKKILSRKKKCFFPILIDYCIPLRKIF